MLDDYIIEEILRRERKKKQWEPVPLELPLDNPQPRIPEREQENQEGPIEIDIWGPETDDYVINMGSINAGSYNSSRYYSNRQIF